MRNLIENAISWGKWLNETEWNLKDNSTKPKLILTKITQIDKEKIISIRNKTGWCAEKIKNFVDLSHTTINKVLQENNLTNPNPRRKKRLKYIQWQRKHPNSLWQMDVSDQKIKDKYCFAMIDGCSRYCVGLIDLNVVTTKVVTQILDELGRVHGFPREILTDNGNVFGLRNKHSKFDRRCRKRGIKHIRASQEPSLL